MANFNDSPDIAETLQDGYGFYLEGTIKQHLQSRTALSAKANR